MLENIKAVIFDMDGSLIDSMWIWPVVDREYLARYDLSMPASLHDDIEGMSFTETAEYFANTFPQIPLTVEEIMQDWTDMVYEKYTKEVPLKEGAMKFLTMLRNRGVKLGIATSNGRTLVDATLKALKIAPLFDSIRTACEVCAGKPAPDVYLKVAEDLGVNPNHCLVFEDIPNGIQAGKNAGMKVCAVEDAFSYPLREKKRMLADFYIQDYRDILNQTYENLKENDNI